MNIDVPTGWSEKGGGVEQSYYLAENEHGVSVGYSLLAQDAYSVWAGDDWTDNKTLASSCSSEGEAKMKALQFMENHPDARWEANHRGLGYLKDSDGNHISIR